MQFNGVHIYTFICINMGIAWFVLFFSKLGIYHEKQAMWEYARSDRASEMDGTGFDEKTENGPSDNKRDKNKGSSKDISEEDDTEVEESKGLRQTEKEGSIWLRLKRDKLYREKYILTMAYFLSFLMLVCFNKYCL